MKKNGLKVVLTIVALLVACFVVKELQEPSNNEGQITVVVVNQSEEEVVRKEVKIKKDQSFESLLKEHFNVRIENGMLMEIEGVSADNRNFFLKIFINGVAANYGVKQIKVEDQDVITIAYTKVGDF